MGGRAGKLTAKQLRFVAAYLGESRGNATDAARRAGYSGGPVVLATQGFDNLRNPKIADAVADAESKIERRGIALKQERIDAKVERWRALRAVRAARAEAFRAQIAADSVLPETRRRPVPPGWETGFHVRQVKAIPNGRGGSEVVEEFALDATMLREFDTLEKEIAQELGEVSTTKVDVNHRGTVNHDHRHYDYSNLSLEEQFSLDQMLARVQDGARVPG